MSSSDFDFEKANRILAGVGTSLSEAVGNLVTQLRKAVTPSFILMVLKHNYTTTPRWRFIRRWTLRRKIAEVEAIIEAGRNEKA